METRVRTPLGLRRQTCRSRAKFGPTFATNQASPPRLIPQISRSTSQSDICAVGLMTPDTACDFALRPIPFRHTPSESRVSTCNGWRNATSIRVAGSDSVRCYLVGAFLRRDRAAPIRAALHSEVHDQVGIPRMSETVQNLSEGSARAVRRQERPTVCCRRGRRRACHKLRSGNRRAARREWSSPWTGAPLRGQQEKAIQRIHSWRQQPPRPTQPGPCRSS